MINKDFLYTIVRETIYPTAPKAKPAVKSVKNTKVPPPIRVEEKLLPPYSVYNLYVLTNNRAMQLVSKIRVDEKSYFNWGSPTDIFNFYNYSKVPKAQITPDTDGMTIVNIPERKWIEGLKPWHFYYDETFNLTIIPVGDSIRITDGNFKLLKTLKYDEVAGKVNQAEQFLAKKYPQDSISIEYAGFAAPVSIGMAGSNQKPFWSVQKQENIFTLSYLENDSYLPYLSMEAEAVDILWPNGLKMTDSNKNELIIQLDRKRLQLPVPLKYKEQFKIKRIQ